MPITVTPTAIPDVLIVEPKVFGDDRGWFFESFNEKDFSTAVGRSVTFVQDNHSSSKKGVLRGLHYQMEQTQGKLVRVCRGVVFDVAVDLRQSSSTFGKWAGVELSAENKKQLWVPPGFAHGFLTLSATADILYKCDTYYHKKAEAGIRYNDPQLKIDWGFATSQLILSEKDTLLPLLGNHSSSEIQFIS
jgi:dTDP-4-dehydrorhamnose 3,5-epimerase